MIEIEQPEGVIVQFGGQTPLQARARRSPTPGVPLLGTPVESIHLAEDRPSFGGAARRARPAGARPTRRPTSPDEALDASPTSVGYPLLVRPSYVLGGRAMEICYSPGRPRRLPRSDSAPAARRADHGMIFLDRFLENAIEVDVDALCDGETAQIGAIMQHVEEAGVHSGDSACVIPAMSLGPDMLRQVEEATERIALGLGVIGLINIQFAVYGDDELYVIEANPRASRTVPVRVEGDRRAAGEDRLPADARRAARGHGPADSRAHPSHVVGQGGGAAVRALPARRLAARPGDEVDRRGDGRRLRLPGRVRQGPGGGRRRAARRRHASSSPSPTATSPPPPSSRPRFHDLGFEVLATGGTAQAIRRMGVPGRADQEDLARARRTSSTGSSPATSTS